VEGYNDQTLDAYHQKTPDRPPVHRTLRPGEEHEALIALCRESDLPVPMWLEKHEREFERFRRTAFLPTTSWKRCASSAWKSSSRGGNQDPPQRRPAQRVLTLAFACGMRMRTGRGRVNGILANPAHWFPFGRAGSPIGDPLALARLPPLPKQPNRNSSFLRKNA
jgi:hypothetical protein